MNEVGSCIPEPSNAHSHNAKVVKIKITCGERDATTVGHVPDSLAEVLYKLLLEKEIKMTCCVSGQSRSTPEGVWVQGGGIEIPCFYQIDIKEGLKSLRIELRDKLLLNNLSWQVTTQYRQSNSQSPSMWWTKT